MKLRKKLKKRMRTIFSSKLESLRWVNIDIFNLISYSQNFYTQLKCLRRLSNKNAVVGFGFRAFF